MRRRLAMIGRMRRRKRKRLIAVIGWKSGPNSITDRLTIPLLVGACNRRH
jgi:hypothetical protein